MNQQRATGHIIIIVSLGVLTFGLVLLIFSLGGQPATVSAQPPQTPGLNSTLQTSLTVQGNFVEAADAMFSLRQTSLPATGSQVRPGDNLAYTVQVTNTGTSTATAVSVEGALPLHTSLILSGTAKGSLSLTPGDRLIWEVGTLAPSELAQAQFTLRVQSPPQANTTIVNNFRVYTNAVPLNTFSNLITFQVIASATTYMPLVRYDPTPTPDPLVLPEFANAGFERGDNGDWTEISEAIDDGIIETLIVENDELPKGLFPITPHTGNWAAWLGGLEAELASLQQDVFIPDDDDFQLVRLTYWYWLESTEEDCDTEDDFAAVYANDDLLEEYLLCEDTLVPFEWREERIDITEYKGQTVTFRFAIKTDDDDRISSFYLDDTGFEVGIPATSLEEDVTPGPQPTPDVSQLGRRR